MAKTNINLAGLSLGSTGTSHGVSYTPSEKRLHAALACALLMAHGETIADDKQVPLTEEETTVLQAAIDATPVKNRSLPGLVAAAYKGNFKRLFGEKATIGDESFPKLRDPTSQRLLLREAVKSLGARDEVLAAIPTYGAKKKDESAA